MTHAHSDDTTPVEHMDLVGGELCLDLVNTGSHRRIGPFREKLNSYDDLVTWAERIGLVGAARGAKLRRAAERSLDRIGITVNKQVVPDDPLPPLKPSGIRLGTPACTTRGMDEVAMRRVAGWIVQTLRAPQDEALLTRLASEVGELARLYPIPALSS